MTKLEISLSILKILCPYALLFTCLLAPNVRQDVLSMIVGASCALLTPASFTSKKDGTTVLSTNAAVVTDPTINNGEILPEEISSTETYTPDDKTWH